MTSVQYEMESYRRILDELVRQVEESENAGPRAGRRYSHSDTHDLNDKIGRLEGHIRALSRATKDDSEAHNKLLSIMQRALVVVEHDGSESERIRKGDRQFSLQTLRSDFEDHRGANRT